MTINGNHTAAAADRELSDAERAGLNAALLVAHQNPAATDRGLAAITYALLALRETIADQGQQLRDVIGERGDSLDSILDSGLFQIGLEILGTAEAIERRPGLFRRAADRIRSWLTRPGDDDRIVTVFDPKAVPQAGPGQDAPYLLARTRCPNPAGEWVLQEQPGHAGPHLPGGEAYLDGPADMSMLELGLWVSTQIGRPAHLGQVGTDPDGPVYAVRPVDLTAGERHRDGGDPR